MGNSISAHSLTHTQANLLLHAPAARGGSRGPCPTSTILNRFLAVQQLCPGDTRSSHRGCCDTEASAPRRTCSFCSPHSGDAGLVPSLCYKLSFSTGSLSALLGPHFPHCHRIWPFQCLSVQPPMQSHFEEQHRLSALRTLAVPFSGVNPCPSSVGGTILWTCHEIYTERV